MSVLQFLSLAKTCFLLVFQSFQNLLEILHMIMATLVSNLTVAEAHDEFGVLIGRIAAKNEELISGKYGEAGSADFIAKIQELAPLYSHLCQLCKKLNLPWPQQLWWPPFFKH